jgi:hypothetical protein
MAEIDLEGLLRSAAAGTEYPETPDVRERVLRSIGPAYAEAPALSLTLSRRARGQAFARIVIASLVVVMALAAALAVTPSREAIARFFGVKGSTIEVVPSGTMPTPAATRTFAPGAGPIYPVPLGNIATPTMLGSIPAATGFEAKLPEDQSEARASFVVALGADRVVLLQFDDFDLWEARLAQEANFGKGIEANSIREELTVNGEPATWLSGTPHHVYYTDSHGIRIEASLRTVTQSTLIWRTGYAFYRIETSLPKEEAVKIAETLP